MIDFLVDRQWLSDEAVTLLLDAVLVSVRASLTAFVTALAGCEAASFTASASSGAFLAVSAFTLPARRSLTPAVQRLLLMLHAAVPINALLMPRACLFAATLHCLTMQ